MFATMPCNSSIQFTINGNWTDESDTRVYTKGKSIVTLEPNSTIEAVWLASSVIGIDAIEGLERVLQLIR
jgi:hypothetical protein